MRILVGFPAGGGTDGIARTLAERLKDELGVPVIVENRAGAGGQIAAQALKAAPADGTTYFISHDHTISILPLVVKNPGFDPAQDFVPVAGFATFVNALAVSPGTPAKSFNEYLAAIRGQGGKSAVGVPAPASVPEFLVKVIGEKYKLDLVSVPYRGSAPLIGDMLASQIPAGVASVPEFVENHKAGKLRVIAVLGGAPAGRAARGADIRRTRACRLRGRAVLRVLRAGRHAAGRTRPLRRGTGESDRDARGEGQADGVGPDRGLHAASATRRARTRLCADVGEDHQGERLPAAVTAAGVSLSG